MIDNISLLVQLFINEHENDIDDNNFDKVYSDAYVYFKDNAHIGELTEVFKSVDINPEEYFTSAIQQAFAYQTTDITEIKIHKDIVRIGGEAFYQSSLKTVVFEEGSRLKMIAMYAFRATLLEEVDLPEGIETISNYSFGNCGHLKRIYIPDSVTSIANTAFFGSRNFIIECHANSTAHKFALANKIEVKLV